MYLAMKRLILTLTALASLTMAAHADRTYTRRFTDSHCQTHIQEIRVDDDGNEEVENDIIISYATDCDGN
jgi:hypothetical protein